VKIENVPIDKIQEGRRYRKDEGDLEALAQSIRELGLLQRISINKYYELIFGARRLHACRHILGWAEQVEIVTAPSQRILGQGPGSSLLPWHSRL
jgi:ParB-like chromosome segregation protein Spo0J